MSVRATRPTLIVIVTTMVVGALAGVLWARVTPLPGYLVNADGGASTTERGLADFIIGDVVFAGVGLVVGIGLGILCWRAFGRRLGWLCVPLAAVASVIAAVLCWQIGQLVGPNDFDVRLRSAQVGDFVPIDLRLRAHTAIAAWVLGACAALMVLTAVARDPEEGGPLQLPWTIPEDDQGREPAERSSD